MFEPQRVKVTIYTRGITVDSVYTDDMGRFFFQNLPGNAYLIVVQEEGYRPIEERVAVTPSLRVNYYVFLNLQPLETRPEPAGDGKIEGSNPHLVTAADFMNHYPKQVRSEYDRGLQA